MSNGGLSKMKETQLTTNHGSRITDYSSPREISANLIPRGKADTYFNGVTHHALRITRHGLSSAGMGLRILA